MHSRRDRRGRPCGGRCRIRPVLVGIREAGVGLVVVVVRLIRVAAEQARGTIVAPGHLTADVPHRGPMAPCRRPQPTRGPCPTRRSWKIDSTAGKMTTWTPI